VNTSYFWAFLRDGLAVWLASFAGARTLLHFHGGDFPEFVAAARPSARRWIEATLRRADGLIALTEHTRVYLASVAPPERVHYFPNFVRLEDFDPVPVRGAGGGPVEILYVGWLLEAKGVRELVQAVRGLPKARLTLVGPEDPAFVASLRPDLEALGERVRVLPPRPREEVRKLYRDADLLVLPTWREGFPTVVLEAMAAGLPLVATPVGAIPEAVRDGEEGLLVPPRDLPALRGALGRLIDDPALRADLGGRARARAEALYSQTAVVRLLASLYAELLPGS
jgi:glycosyltransferase involved in cell wall biosynthesis